MDKIEDPDSPKDIFNENELIGVCLDFFEAGGETVGTTLLWVLLFLAAYPEEQRKCQDEIDSAVGKSRNVALSDKPDLPQCEAFINEVQRMSCVAPAGLEHRASEDTNIYGYFIPQGNK